MKTLLITGGAGYLGSCTAETLATKGYRIVIVDDFSTACPRNTELEILETNLVDLVSLRRVLDKSPPIDGIIHFAARALVTESCEKPWEYLHNNCVATLNVAQVAAVLQVPVLHSSSCAVYGYPLIFPIGESSPIAPVSPYGESKYLSERILNRFAQHQNLSVCHLRYFNPAGALKIEGRWVGENHQPETHLVPKIIEAGLHQKPVTLFGTDFDTPDGSAVRDFIHIMDLVEAHEAALHYLWKKKPPVTESINIGSGQGISVIESIQRAESVLGTRIPKTIGPRRNGDPPRLVADITLAKSILNWVPKLKFEAILESDAQFRKQL